MKTLAVKAVVTSADGFYYREEHEWRNMPQDDTQQWFADRLKEAPKLAAKVNASTKEDGDVLTAVCDAIVDGKAEPTIRVENMSYTELAGFQDLWDDWGAKLRGVRAKRVKVKQKKHREGRGGGGRNR